MRRWFWGVLLIVGCLLGFSAACWSAAEKSQEIWLRLIPTSPTAFTNAIPHTVTFDAEVEGAEKLTLRVYNPEGEIAGFRTQKQVQSGERAVRAAGYALRAGQTRKEDLNVFFKSDTAAGTWRVEVTASGTKKKPVTASLAVEIRPPDPLELGQLEETHALLRGTEGSAVPAEEGKIRFVAQDPADPSFVRDYWLSKKYDLRDSANQKCSRAVFSMALSYLGIDCTPVRMSEMLWGEDILSTFDPVCEKLGGVERVTGDLETLWAAYEAGEASPVLLHFTYDGGMHALLVAGRDREKPELFYCVTSGQPVNTSEWPDGLTRDHVIPILIERGEIGQWIQSPLLKRYHKGRIDEIWQWKRTDTP